MADRIVSEAFLDEIIRALASARHPDFAFREISSLITTIHQLPVKDKTDDPDQHN